MYILTKLQIEDGKDSMLPTGYATVGNSLSVFKYDIPDSVKGVKRLTEIKAGWQVYIAHHNTSKIKEIVEQSDTRVLFRTQTSLYELTQTKD